MADEIIKEVEEVEVLTTYEVEDNLLKKIKTPSKVVPEVESYNIKDIKEEIEKYKNARAQWDAKIAPLQAIVDKYDELNPPVEEVVIK